MRKYTLIRIARIKKIRRRTQEEYDKYNKASKFLGFEDKDEHAKRLLQIKELGNYIIFWEVTLQNDNSVVIEFSDKQKDKVYFLEQNAYSSVKLAQELNRVRNRMIGEPPKSVVFIRCKGYGQSNYKAWLEFQEGIRLWVDNLKKEWESKSFCKVTSQKII